MYYLNKIIKYSKYYNYYFKNGFITKMMPDTCTLNTWIAQKELIKILISIVVLMYNYA